MGQCAKGGAAPVQLRARGSLGDTQHARGQAFCAVLARQLLARSTVMTRVISVRYEAAIGGGGWPASWWRMTGPQTEMPPGGGRFRIWVLEGRLGFDYPTLGLKGWPCFSEPYARTTDSDCAAWPLSLAARARAIRSSPCLSTNA